MKVLVDEDLSKYTTIRIGGKTNNMLIPETTEELIEVVNDNSPKYYIGGGSNLLINNRVFELVVNLRSFNTSIQYLGDGKVLVGASVRLQKLINKINELGLGGIEYLYSVPGLVGGAVVMNAGRGRQFNKSISDYIEYVDAICDGGVNRFSKSECGFSYRNSFFKNSDMIITSVLFCFPSMDVDESAKAKAERIALCKEKQDNSYPNFGSVFCYSNSAIMKIARTLKIGTTNVHFSNKTLNWIVNENNGSFDETLTAIKKVELLHIISLQKSKREVIVWE